MEGLRFFALLYFLSIIKFIKTQYIFIDIHYCAGLLFCILNEWAAESFFSWDTYAWYYPISLLFDILIYDDAAVWMTCSAFVGYLLALVCAGQYKKRALPHGSDPFGMSKFRLLFGLGVLVFGGIFFFLSMATAGWDSFGWWVVFVIILYSWTAVLSYAALTYGVERLVKFTRKDDSFRISPIRKGIASLPYFVAVFAVVYWIEMH